MAAVVRRVPGSAVLVRVIGVLIFPAAGTPVQQIMLLSFRFSGGLSPREHLPGKAANSPAHAHRRC